MSNKDLWFDKLKSPGNVDDTVRLIKSLVHHYNGMFCIDKKVFSEKFSFMMGSSQKNFDLLIVKLQCDGYYIRSIKNVNTLDKLYDGIETDTFIISYVWEMTHLNKSNNVKTE